MAKRQKFLPIVSLEHRQIHKETRIRGLIPRYAAGKIYHIGDECKGLEEEMFTFPKGLHDDIIDATAYQIQIAEQSFVDRKQTVAPHKETKEHIHEAI